MLMSTNKSSKVTSTTEMSKFKFTEGEKVLCFHGPLIYEAKTLKSSVTKDKQVKYYIHYAGWNKNWDEWVPENRVLKYNDANIQKQTEVFKQHSSAANKKKGGPKGKKSDVGAVKDKDGSTGGGNESRASTPSKESTPVSTSSSRRDRSKQSAAANNSTTKDSEKDRKDDGKDDSASTTSKDDKDEPPAKKKRGNSNQSEKATNEKSTPGNNASNSSTNNTTANATTPSVASSTASSVSGDTPVETEPGFLSKMEVKIKIPHELKQCLADDWDAITRQQKLLDIPSKVTVQDIFDQYLQYRKTSKSTTNFKESVIRSVVDGLIEYFNVMLGSQLLYKYERPQYAEILQKNPETPPSKLYGSFHLLRLFVKLGTMVTFSAMDEKSLNSLLINIHDFLKFLSKNCGTYFDFKNYVNADPEYHRKTQ